MNWRNHADIIERFASRARDERTIVAATHDTGMIDACNAQHSRRQVTLTAVALAGPAVGRAL
jgi:ABC-type lipoprotein export system ATPase subunit